MDSTNRIPLPLFIGFWVVLILFVTLIWPHTAVWNGDGSVDVAPNADSVKNYRLDADITVTEKSHGWVHGSYSYYVSRVSWPNGGYSTFDDCTVPEDGYDSCIDQEDNEYQIQVIKHADQPYDDTYDDY